MENKEIKRILKETLTKSRYKHTMGVAHTAQSLAMRYRYDIDTAYIAGMLHDNAKCIRDSEQVAECEAHGIPVTDVERRNPYLLHGKLGAYYAQTKFETTSPEICSAITWHTTGRPDMTLLEKIIFVADYIEPRRDRAPRLSDIRYLAFTDIDKAIVMICEDTINYIVEMGTEIDEMTKKTLEYYSNI